MSNTELLKRTLLVVSVAAIPVLVWYLFDLILIAFGAIILAMLLRLGAQPIIRLLSISEPIALLISGLLILAVIIGWVFFFGARLAGEMQDVVQRASSASAAIEASLRGSTLGNFLINHIAFAKFSFTEVLSGLLKISSSFLEATIIMVIGGVYLAVQPNLYRHGLIFLFPPRSHVRTAEILDGIGEALRLWLLGQLVEMILIGALSTSAVWMIGVPSPFALGLIAAIGEFIPYLGPILAAIPAILVAGTRSPETALWTLLAYLIIHQVEGQIITPLIQRHMLSIPPAVMLLGIVAITYMFGMIAVVFAAPILVVIFAAVNLLYVRNTLGETTDLTRKLEQTGMSR